jgi:SAM-dependent methyltransferase
MEWFRRWFGPLYEDLYGHRDSAEAHAQVVSLLSRLGRIEGPVLDAGCGSGRHLRELREQGLRAVGADLSAHLLTGARSGGPVVRADLRQPPFKPGSFGLVAAFFSVFGYLDTPEQDLHLLDVLVDLVAPRGYLFLDLPDPDHVRAHLVARDSRSFPGGTALQERWIEDGCVHKRITVTREAGAPPELYLERVRLWDRESVEQEASKRGLEPVALLGTSDGHPWEPGSPRLGFAWRRC